MSVSLSRIVVVYQSKVCDYGFFPDIVLHCDAI